MKKEFIKEHGKMIEKFVIDNEATWIYVQFFKGNFEKAAYFLKSNPDKTTEYVENFLNDYHVSEEIKSDVRKYLDNQKGSVDRNFQDFLNFLITVLSLHVMVGFALGLSIFGGFQLGVKLDSQINSQPAFTVIGVLFGIAIGGLIGYVMIYNYFGRIAMKDSAKANRAAKMKIKKNAEWPAIDATLNDVREAVRSFSEDLPKGINRTILVKADFSIDLAQLAPYLGGIPSKPFYMSKETYEIFEEKEKDLPPIIDKVQKSVHLFYKVNKKYPIKPYDSLHRVNYYQLLQDHYLDEKPDIDLYFTEFDGLITHQRPKKKQMGS